MDDSGDIEFLERQVSLLQEFLRNLDRRRQERRRDSHDSSPPPTPAGPSPIAAAEAPPAQPLRLVSSAPDAVATAVGRPPGDGHRRPRFREKRRWDLSAAAGSPRPQEMAGAGHEPDAEPQAAPAATGTVVPWKAYEALLRQRDDLLLQLSHHHAAEARLMEERAAGERKDEEIRNLQDRLREVERRDHEDLLRHLRRRLQVAEELEDLLLRRTRDE
jgi:hypothetical protein